MGNIEDVVNFLDYSLDILPIYSHRRILKAIFETYYKYVEFPKLLFAKKIIIVLKKIYKITNLDEKKIVHDLNKINSESLDLYSYFLHDS